MSGSITWPAVIRQVNVSELIYIDNRDLLHGELEAHRLSPGDDCKLIDSMGRLYELTQSEGGEVVVASMGAAMSLDEFTGLVRSHAAHIGSCCISKFSAASFREAIRVVASLVDD